MGQLRGQILVNASAEAVWEALSDLGAAHAYDPSVTSSRYISKNKHGVGAARHCEVKSGYLKERVIEWHEGHSYKIEVFESKGVPFKSLIAEFAVQAEGSRALVTQTMNYKMKGGPLAPILSLIARGIIKKAQRGTLEGLKQYVERERA